MQIRKAQNSNLKVVSETNSVALLDIPEIESTECETCFGTGIEVVKGKGARPCACRQTGGAINPYLLARIPEKYLDKDLSNFSVIDSQTGMINRSLDRAREKSLRFIKSYPKVQQGLLFTGNAGVGKTHLATSIVKGLIDRNFSNCLFYEFGSLIKEIHDSYNTNTNASELQLLQPVFKAEVLVLDEIGASKPTEWAKDTLMYIINNRYNNEKITIFTTNYLDEKQRLARVDREYVTNQILRSQGTPTNLDSLKKSFESYTIRDWDRLIEKEKLRLQVSDESLTERIGYRLRSRIYEMCEEVYINGQDYRTQFEKKSKQ